MNVLQASPAAPDEAIEQAKDLGCDAIAWSLQLPSEFARQRAKKANLRSEGWISVARDPEAAAAHPEWMHAPQHHEWLERYPNYTGQHPALVAPYIGLNTRPAFDHALARAADLISKAPWATRVWVADIQGPPMGCGCGNPCCRSWDNAPGEKVAATAYDNPQVLFPLEFFLSLQRLTPGRTLIPVLCPECERGIDLSGAEDPDGPHGTNLCRGIPCVRPCALDFWPSLLAAFRNATEEIGLLLATEALEKNHPVYGAPRSWPRLAHAHYGVDLIPCVEPEDAGSFDRSLVLTDAPQDAWPMPPPIGYEPTLPAIMCNYCPPSGAPDTVS